MKAEGRGKNQKSVRKGPPSPRGMVEEPGGKRARDEGNKGAPNGMTSRKNLERRPGKRAPPEQGGGRKRGLVRISAGKAANGKKRPCRP